MLSNYRICRRKQELGTRITHLHSTQLLAVGILDASSVEALLETLDWYVQFMNYSLHVITQEGRLDIPTLQNKYRDVTFLVFAGNAFTGEKINALANECQTNLFLVVRSDAILVRFNGEMLLATMAESEHPAAFCAVIANAYREIVPCVRIPRLVGRELDPDSDFPILDEQRTVRTLYPLMCLGLYDRALFQRLRGFDEDIHSEYYQALDWGLRCHLLGYDLAMSSSLMMQFIERESVIEDRSDSEGYERCYTKALSILQVDGKNSVKKYKGYFDKAAYQNEVKKRMLWLQKRDFYSLITHWKEDKV
ncbi:MAG: hypothetical protein EOM15_11530 [Spirochaetia bacterium]|nr:hypothetical protein [Spirochaetia bacterium]